MNNNREERLQMRQRGAATRKAKEFDFGFSFGLAPAAEEPPSQTTSQPAEIGTVIESADLPAPTPTPIPELTEPPHVSPVRALSVSNGQESSQRTPRSARNGLPERPSMFDIPSDENMELERSNKRRKIGSPSKFAAVTTSASLDMTVQNNSDPQPLPNESASDAPLPTPNGPDGVPSTFTPQAPQDILKSGTTETSGSPVGDKIRESNGVANAIRAEEVAPVISDGLQPQIVSASPPNDNDRNTPDSESQNREPPQSYVAPEQLMMTQSPAEPDSTEPTPPKQVSPAQVSVKQRSPKQRSPKQRSPKQVSPAQVSVKQRSPKQRSPKQRSPKQVSSTQKSSKQATPEQVTPEQATSNEVIVEEVIPEGIVLQEVVLQQATQQQALPEEVVPEQIDESTQQTTQSSEALVQQDSTVDTGGSQPQRQKRFRGRPPAASRAGSSASTDIHKAKTGPIEVSLSPVSGNERLRSRSTRSGRSASKVAAENGTPNGASISTPAPQPEEVQPEVNSDEITNKEQAAETTALQQSVPKKKKRAGRPAKVRPDVVQDKPQPSDGNAEIEAQIEAEKEQEPEPEPEEVETPPANAEESHLSTQPDLVSKPKKRRGRPSLASKRNDAHAGEAEAQQQQQQETQPETGEEAPQPVKKRIRQPRGETVPVTVHRLVNAASLAEFTHLDSPAEEEDSADELATRRKTKLPSRGGVNPADVLSQICRETLDKTLTTLKNGISNETNPARRAEWTRKKKAVEAFETELEGRLFELSEMLDSNFILGLQLRKAKREMMDLRGRLYQVRKEREAVALRMDAVRRKHAEEEEARMARMSISNSLHSLELAVERGQTRSSAAVGEEDSADASSSPTSGLEFLLRSVAENVSSAAPGAQGGLLDQIKSFNAQLEATARRLES